MHACIVSNIRYAQFVAKEKSLCRTVCPCSPVVKRNSTDIQNMQVMDDMEESNVIKLDKRGKRLPQYLLCGLGRTLF